MPKIVYQDSAGVEKTVALGTEPVHVGRANECEIQTQDGLVSRRHARIVLQDGQYWVEDLGSANGVFMGSQRVQRAQLNPGDRFMCGSLSLHFVADGTSPVPAAPAAPSVPVVNAPPAATTQARAPAVPSAELESTGLHPVPRPPAAPAAPSDDRQKLPPRVSECLLSIRDGLADVRTALKAAGDELALEQMEHTRERLREVMKLLGIEG